MPNPSSPTTFVRAWPPSPDGVQPGGDELGFLRYCPRTPAAALRVNVIGSEWVMLDPMVTAPNAVIGLAFDPPRNRAAWHFMRPGDVVYAGGQFSEFWLFNADNLDLFPGGLPVAGMRPLGYCGFLVGRGTPPTRGGITPPARTCGVCDNTGINAAGIWLPPGNCKRFLVSMLPISAAGVLLAASVWTGQLNLQYADARQGADNSATGLDRETLDSVAAITALPENERLWIRGGMASFELPVDPSGMLVHVAVTSIVTWSGVAVDHLLLQAEGY